MARNGHGAPEAGVVSLVANQPVRLQQVAKWKAAHHTGWTRPLMNLGKYRRRETLRGWLKLLS